MRHALGALLLLAACQPLATEPHPANPLADYATIEFRPADDPFGYHTHLFPEWWADVEQCSGLGGAMSRVRWFTFTDPDVSTFQTLRGTAAATWVESENAILLPQGRLTEELTVKHEMLHALIGHGGHGPEFDRCGIRNGSPHD